MKVVIVALAAIGIIVLMALVFAFPLMWLWNWLMPVIFGLIKIDFWQALGLLILSGMLFKNTGSSSSKD